MKNINNGIIEAESHSQALYMLENLQKEGEICTFYISGHKLYNEQIPSDIDGIIDSSKNITSKYSGYGKNLRHLVTDEDKTYFPFCAKLT